MKNLEEVDKKVSTIIKKDNREEAYSREKLDKVLDWTTNNETSYKEILIRDTEVKLKEKIKAKELFEAFMNTAIQKISPLQTKWEFIASKFYLLSMYSESWGIKNKKYPHLKDVLKKGVESKVYQKDIVDTFTDEEIEDLNSYIRPTEDYTFTYNALKQFNGKYCKKYSKTKKLELPQITYMRVSMGLAYNLDNKIEVIKKMYDILTKGYATVATPIMMNSMTPLNQFSSCILNTIGNDTWDIANKLVTAGTYTKGRGGLAFDVTHIQAKGSLTNNGVLASGITPYIKNIEAVVSSFMQGDCYTEDTEILTEKGWKLFKELNNEKVAQYNEDGTIEFVKYTDYIKLPHKGDVYNFMNIGEHIDLTVTPNHRMVKLTEANNLKIEFAQDISYSEKSKMIVSGNKNDTYLKFTNIDKLKIAYQADGYTNTYINKEGNTSYYFRLKKDRKIDRLLSIVESIPEISKIDIKTQKDESKIITIITSLELKKDFSWVDLNNINSAYGKEFIKELGYWDGSYKGTTVTYNNTSKKSIDICQAIASISGVRTKLLISERVGRKNCYRLTCVDSNIITSSNNISKGINKTREYYEGFVYCVSVPSTMLVVRRNNKVVISGNSRRGSAVITCAWWHKDIEDFLELKDASSGTPENRALHLKYAFATNDYFMNKVLENDDIYLFCPKDAESLLYVYGDAFVKNYEELLSRKGIIRKKINARELYKKFLKYRFQTGNVYETMLDNINKANMTNRYVGSSNLCQEVLIPSRPAELIEEVMITKNEEEYMSTNFKNEEIGLCNLSAFNLCIFNLEESEIEDIIYTVTLLLDNTIDIGKTMRVGGRYTNKNYRYIGLGGSNYAYYLADKGIDMDSREAEIETVKLFQRFHNHTIRASCRLAREKGIYPKFRESKWAEGILPIDLANERLLKEFSEYIDYEEIEKTRQILKSSGIRNGLVMNFPPTASSASSKNLTESIEPIMNFSYRVEGAVSCQVLAPDLARLRQYYKTAYSIDPKRLVKLNAIRQMFIDQSQSVNMYIDESKWNYEYLANLHIYSWQLGVKTHYYLFTPKSGGDESCESCSS